MHQWGEAGEEAMKSLNTLMRSARAELRTNPTITVYEMLDGEEWNRHAANPWIGITSSFKRLGETAKSVNKALDDFKQALREAQQ